MKNRLKTLALTSCAVIALATAAQAQDKAKFDIAGGDLKTALQTFATQTSQEVLFSTDIVAGRHTKGVTAETDPQTALVALLDGTGLTYQRTPTGTLLVVRASDPQSGSAAGAGADAGTVQALVVTAQKREENIQDVPIAMSAFTQEALERSQVAGGPDLMTQVPNMTFTKTNFSGYSIQLRGIGTQAISATTDPAVAVAFNNTPFIRNRFFEQEFYDLQRVEVLRGPQGTLYGRNATAGVVNLISAKPTFRFESKLSADVGNYKSTRLEGMINIPLVEDKVALRLAGAWTKREGYSTNQLTGNAIDGRDLWSGRATLRFEPTDGISANLIYEHFEEDDDRLRSGKQVCKKDPGPNVVNGVPVPADGGGVTGLVGYVSQGCLPASIYADESFQTPNGFALPFYGPTTNLGNWVNAGVDPYLSTTQSRDLRVIESMVDPEYRANTDVVQLQVSFELTPQLTLVSETAYSADTLFSTQDYNRFNTKPDAWTPNIAAKPGILNDKGEFCDPQIGCSDRLVLVDLSTAKSQHFSEEIRVSSDFDGPLNFSVGANFLRYDTEDKYYVFVNSLGMFAARSLNNLGVPWLPGVSDNHECLDAALRGSIRNPDPTAVYDLSGCIYIDPNPIGKLNDQGRNYFLSKNPYRLISYAAFGEVYYNISENLKLTGGLRFTIDKKRAPQIPSWLLAGYSVGDYPVLETVDQEWREPTGRLAVDWKPNFALTDETLLYASYAHGYKAGGANPPPPVFATYNNSGSAGVDLQGHPDTFGAEYVDAFEAGSKNTLLDGRMTLNLGAFYYDYQGYQISQIIDRSAVNSNFDAKVWGAEIEADWRPLENLRLGFKGGYEKTRMADGSKAIDTMDRTAGMPGWMVVRPFPTVPSNCILPTYVAVVDGQWNLAPFWGVSDSGACVDAYGSGKDPATGAPYTPFPIPGSDYPGFDPKTAPNGGKGFDKDLSGNELPNAPHFTATITADYTLPLPSNWLMTLHTDLYYQSEAWTRIFNTEGYDKLKAYNNINVAAIFTNEDAGWKVMAYVKNVLDRDSITGAFLNSDDTGLTTNVFMTEPRLYGLRVTKEWNGGSPLGGLLDRRRSHGPYPFQIEVGAGVTRTEAPNQVFAPGFIDEYEPSLRFPLGIQDDDLGWSDQRDIKFTYAPQGGWRVSVAARFGKTAEGATKVGQYEQLPGGILTKYGQPDRYVEGPENTGISSVRDSEKHAIAEFMIGRDVGIGAMGAGGASGIGFGLRYAHFDSTSAVKMEGTPDWYFQTVREAFKYKDHHSEYTASLDSERSFEGMGPVLSWDAAKVLAGDDASGRLNLDWTVTGGVLFGKQKTETGGKRKGLYTHYPESGGIGQTTDVLYDEPIGVRRNEDVTVPTLGGSLGLSYAIDRIKLGAGYRWERYFNAIDGGIDTHESFDRTIQGPYFKLSVGFGGG